MLLKKEYQEYKVNAASSNLVSIFSSNASYEHTEDQWLEIIALARQLDLNAQLFFQLESNKKLDTVPKRIEVHLRSAWIAACRQQNAVRWEIQQISDNVTGPVVLLKGGAYIFREENMGQGRFVSDIDLLVDKSRIAQAEFELFILGFVKVSLDDYDEKYYRSWMHELPPLHHIERGTVIDLHHNLLPVVSGRNIQFNRLAERFENTSRDNIKVLATVDQLIHAAVHLFQDSEFNHTLRDLIDISALFLKIREAGQEVLLCREALYFRLQNDVAMALYFVESVLRFKLSEETRNWVSRTLNKNYFWPLVRCCYARIFFQPVISQHNVFDKMAMLAVIIRSHWIKMPLKILAKHVAHKLKKSIFNKILKAH